MYNNHSLIFFAALKEVPVRKTHLIEGISFVKKQNLKKDSSQRKNKIFSTNLRMIKQCKIILKNFSTFQVQFANPEHQDQYLNHI